MKKIRAITGICLAAVWLLCLGIVLGVLGITPVQFSPVLPAPAPAPAACTVLDEHTITNWNSEPEHQNTDAEVAWNDDKNLTTAPVATDSLWVEPMYGVKLLVKYVIAADGAVERDIYAFPSKEEIYGDSHKRADSARRAAGDAARTGLTK